LKADQSAKKRCKFDEDQSSCNEELSAATKTASKKPVDSISEDEDTDMIYVPYDF
jgi:ribosomal protein S20